MQKEEDVGLEIMFHLNVQIEPTLVGTGLSEYRMEWVHDEVSIRSSWYRS